MNLAAVFCTLECIRVSVYEYMYISMHIRIKVFMYVRMYLRLYVCVYLNLCTLDNKFLKNLQRIPKLVWSIALSLIIIFVIADSTRAKDLQDSILSPTIGHTRSDSSYRLLRKILGPWGVIRAFLWRGRRGFSSLRCILIIVEKMSNFVLEKVLEFS